MLPTDEHQKLYGYNFKSIPFPIKEDKVYQAKWLRRMQGIHDFPEQLVPEILNGSKCRRHGNQFDPSEDRLIEESKTLILYSEMGERVFKIPVFSRPTIGQCASTEKFDGTDLLIWNLGQARFVDASVHFSYLQLWHQDFLLSGKALKTMQFSLGYLAH